MLNTASCEPLVVPTLGSRVVDIGAFKHCDTRCKTLHVFSSQWIIIFTECISNCYIKFASCHKLFLYSINWHTLPCKETNVMSNVHIPMRGIC